MQNRSAQTSPLTVNAGRQQEDKTVRRMIRIISAGVLMLGVSPAMARIKDPKDTSTNFNNHGPLAASVRKADKVLLYEGLPDPMFESKLLAEELKSQQTVELHDFPFYAVPLELKETDAKKLTDLYCNQRSFRRFSGVSEGLFYRRGCQGKRLRPHRP